MAKAFNFKEWWVVYVETYKSGKYLFHNQLGAKDGPWLSRLRTDLSRPDLYTRYGGQGCLEVNCTEALERLRADIKVKTKQQRDGQNKTVWQLPMLSVYVGQGERGRRYTWDIDPMTTQAESSGPAGFVCTQCDTPVNMRFGLCKPCADKYESEIKPRVRDDLKRMGIFTEGDTRKQVMVRCRQYLKDSGYTPAAVIRELERREKDEIPGAENT